MSPIGYESEGMDMGVIELADRMARARALALCVFATMSVVLLALSLGPRATDFFRGMWLGLTGVSTLYLTPVFARLKNSPVALLLDDESTRDHRRTSSVFGLWAALIAAGALLGLGEIPGLVSATDTARIIFTAAIAAAQLKFATLELRATR